MPSQFIPAVTTPAPSQIPTAVPTATAHVDATAPPASASPLYVAPALAASTAQPDMARSASALWTPGNAALFSGAMVLLAACVSLYIAQTTTRALLHDQQKRKREEDLAYLTAVSTAITHIQTLVLEPESTKLSPLLYQQRIVYKVDELVLDPKFIAGMQRANYTMFYGAWKTVSAMYRSYEPTITFLQANPIAESAHEKQFIDGKAEIVGKLKVCISLIDNRLRKLE